MTFKFKNSFIKETDVIVGPIEKNGPLGSYFKKTIPVKYHGTGDVFASALVGALTNKDDVEEAIKIATDFVWEAIFDTFNEKKENAYGVNFETFLYKLKKTQEN